MADKVRKKSKKFNFSYFKTLQNHEQILDYISARLPIIGEGTTRVVFAVNTHRVIKVAKNSNGFLQNAAELEMYTNPYSNKVITKINTIGQIDNNITWLYCDLLKPIQSIEEFERVSGLCWQTYTRVISGAAKKIDKPLKDILEAEYQKELKRYNKLKETGTCGDVEACYYELECINSLKKSDFFSSVVAAMKHSGLMPGDLTEYDHYGTNTEGKILLLDYGLTQEVAKKMIVRRNSTMPPASYVDTEEACLSEINEYYKLISIKTRVVSKAQ